MEEVDDEVDGHPQDQYYFHTPQQHSTYIFDAREGGEHANLNNDDEGETEDQEDDVDMERKDDNGDFRAADGDPSQTRNAPESVDKGIAEGVFPHFGEKIEPEDFWKEIVESTNPFLNPIPDTNWGEVRPAYIPI